MPPGRSTISTRRWRDAIRTFFPEGMIELGVDDTLGRRRGLTIIGTGMHHDPLNSSRSRPHVSWGHDWVILSLLIPNPPGSPTKVWALPVGMRLYRNRQGRTKGKAAQDKTKKGKKRPADPNHRTRPELAVELIRQFAARFPERPIVDSGDSAYGGKSVLPHLSENVDLISRVASNAALYEPAPPPRPKQKGAPRKKGPRLPAMAEWAADETRPWEVWEFDQYGLHAKLRVKTMRGLYYKAGKDRLLVGGQGGGCQVRHVQAPKEACLAPDRDEKAQVPPAQRYPRSIMVARERDGCPTRPLRRTSSIRTCPGSGWNGSRECRESGGRIACNS